MKKYMEPEVEVIDLELENVILANSDEALDKEKEPLGPGEFIED